MSASKALAYGPAVFGKLQACLALVPANSELSFTHLAEQVPERPPGDWTELDRLIRLRARLMLHQRSAGAALERASGEVRGATGTGRTLGPGQFSDRQGAGLTAEDLQRRLATPYGASCGPYTLWYALEHGLHHLAQAEIVLEGIG